MSDFLYSMPQHELSTQIKDVAVMGMTGVGKTTFITALTGDNLTLKETLRVEKNSEITHQLRAAYEEMMQKQERIAEEQKRLHQAEMRQLQHQNKES
ncbi:hypothetical protein AARAC_005909 [Aspergillus arachidicola]|uniref:G domain-containing protein n=1 Tax=Aspergillus arachidicola TaxID=656916 RepID=A0A2G7G636_9EURO|nr:hypothetical protein AARAC_005909 [Aspergillus arachidicola]